MPGVFSPVAAKSFAALFIPRAWQPWGVITGFASLCLSPLLPALTLPVSTSSPSVLECLETGEEGPAGITCARSSGVSLYLPQKPWGERNA